MNRQFYQARNPNAVNLANTGSRPPVNFADCVTLTFTPDVSRAYAVFWYVEAYQASGSGSSSDYHHFQLVYDTTIIDLCDAKPRGTGPDDMLVHSGVWVIPANASPSSLTVKLRGGQGAATTRVQVGRNSRLIAVRLEANDTFQTLVDRVERSSGPAPYVPVQVNTPLSGSYLVFGSSAQDGANNAAGITLALTTSASLATSFSPTPVQPPTTASNTAYFSDCMVVARTAPSTSSVNFLHSSNSAVTYQGSRSHCIVAFYEPDLPAVTINQDLNSYQVTAPQSYAYMYDPFMVQTPAAGARLVFAAFGACAGASSGNNIQAHMLCGGEETNAAMTKNFQSSTTRGWYSTYVHFETDVPAERAYTLEWYRASGTSSTITTPFRQMVFMDLSSGGSAPPQEPVRRPTRYAKFL